MPFHSRDLHPTRKWQTPLQPLVSLASRARSHQRLSNVCCNMPCLSDFLHQRPTVKLPTTMLLAYLSVILTWRPGYTFAPISPTQLEHSSQRPLSSMVSAPNPMKQHTRCPLAAESPN